MSALTTMQKLAEVASIFEAAKVLERNGLLGDRDAAAVVRQYVQANPDINQALSKDPTR